MATGGKSDIDEDESTYVEEDSGDDGWTHDDIDDLWGKSELQELEHNLSLLDAGLSADTSSKLKDNSAFVNQPEAETSLKMESEKPEILQRTPKIKSTPWSMQLLAKILVDEYELNEDEAHAAIRCQGCDIDLCLQWVERNRFNFALVEEKAKEFQYLCGMISEGEMKEWIVQRLTSKFNVIEDIAKFAVQNKGCESFKACRMFALEIYQTNCPVVESQSDDKGKEENVSSAVGLQNFQKILLDLDYQPLSGCPWDSFGIREDQLPYQHHNILGFQTMFKWFLRNQYDGVKLRQRSCRDLKETAVEILSDFVPKVAAKAAVQAELYKWGFLPSVDRCLNWIRANVHEEELVNKYYQEYVDSHGSSEFGQNDFVRTSSLKIQKQHKIGPSGGEICLQECGINFPEGALKAEMEFIMSLDNNPKNILENSIPITPILGCRPSITFDRPVTVRMVTSASAVGNAEVMASLYERKTDNSDWVEKRKVVLTNKNLIQFDVMHFSDDVVVLSDDAGDQVDYHLVNDVYMKKGTGTIASIFFVDQGAHDLATEDMCKRGVVPMLMKAKEIIVKMGTEIKVGFASKLPHGTTVTACNSPVIKITPEFLKKRCHEVYYDLEDIPQGYEGIISLRYTLKLDQEEERLPVSTTWPIVIPDKPVLQIEHASIDQHTEVQANVVALQGGTANVQSQLASQPR